MSIPCFTTYKVTGRKRDAEILHQVLQRMSESKIPLVENKCACPNMWLGCLVKELGGNPDEIDCVGYITDYSMQDDVLTVLTQTEGCEMSATRHFIESCFDGMKIYYYEDACQDDILNTNDAEGLYFKTRVFIDSEDYFGVENNYGHFETFEDAAKAVSKIVGNEVAPESHAIEEALDDYMVENHYAWLSYHEVKILNE